MEHQARPSHSEGNEDEPLPGRSAHEAATGKGDADLTRARWAFLAEASRCLADSLNYETTLETVAGLALPLLGSWSIVDLSEPDGSVRRVTIAHPDPEKQAIARELKDGWPPRRDDPLGVSAVARSGKAEFIPEITDEFLVSVARSEENLHRLQVLGMTSLMTVPITTRGRILGAITFIASAQSRRFTDADLSLADDLAARCGLAIDNARLHRAAHALVHSERERHKAEAADRVKTDFLRTVSHELRTPLNIMAGYLELLSMELAGPLTALQRQYVERVQAGEEQLLRIVEDMLNFVRLYSKEIEYNLADVALNTVIKDVAEAYRQGLEDKGLHLEVHCEPGIRAYTDPAKVWQILMNLLSNARKFTEVGGSVTVECALSGDQPAIRVTDSGCGIPEDRLDAIFEPFVQADGSLTRPADGMGLGLSISRHLARDMGGDLTVTSVVSEGCTFTVVLAPAETS
jgi:signal transduction histidine kinase